MLGYSTNFEEGKRDNMAVSSDTLENNLLFSGAKHTDKRMIIAGLDSCIVSDVGERIYNEDSALIVRHPKIPEFKLIAVADGMGGGQSGEKFSSETIKKLEQWFSRIEVSEADFKSSEYYKTVYASLRECIINIDKELKASLGTNGATTLAAAVVCGDYTILLNIGDSRIYNYFDGNLICLTEDQKKFMSANNKYGLTNFLPADGITAFRYNDSYKYIPTNSLGYLVLCTDGVHGVLADSIISDVLLKNSDSTNNMASRLVEYAVASDCEYNHDNTTVAVVRIGGSGPLCTSVMFCPDADGDDDNDNVKVWPPRKR